MCFLSPLTFTRDSDRGGGRRGGGRRDYYDDRRGGGGGGGRFSPPHNTDYRVIVTNLPSRSSWQDLKDLFREAGAARSLC